MDKKTDVRDPDEKVVEIEMEWLRAFPNHPFKVIGDSQMIELQDSIKKYTATVTLTYGDNSILDPERVSAQLCQECFKKVADALWPTGFEKDWTYHCDVLMNMETEDIYPISSTITKCSIDDFWLHIDHEQENNRDIVYLVYNP